MELVPRPGLGGSGRNGIMVRGAGAAVQLARWLPVLAGALMALAAPALWYLHAPAATPYASGLAGLTLLLLGWPERALRPAPTAAVASWTGLARDLHLQGPVVAPGGRVFLPSRAGTVPPLDDRRSLYDGGDGYAAGIALDNPVADILAQWQGADPTRLADAAALEEDLNAIAAWTGWMRNVRVLPEPSGLRVRWETRLDATGSGPGAAAAEACIAWLVAASAARAGSRPVQLATHGPGEALLEWQG